MNKEKLDPDIMLAAMLDSQTVEEAKPRASQINAMFGANNVPTDGHTFMALVMILCSVDAISACPLGADRMSYLVGVMRAQLAQPARPPPSAGSA